MDAVNERFEKRTSSFYISVRRTHIDIELFGESVTTKVVIIGGAIIYGGLEIFGEEREWIEMGDWHISYLHGVLEFVYGDVAIKLCLSSDEIEKILNIILSVA